jgi:acyl carrier protein
MYAVREMNDVVPQEVIGRISSILAAIVRADPAQITPTTSLIADLDIDSVTMVKVVVAVEDHFGAIIPDEEWSRFSTVGDLVTYLNRIRVITPEWSTQP